MSTSGTVGGSVYEVADVVDSVIRRVGSNPSRLTPEVVEIITNNIYLVLSNMSNRGINLWRVFRPLYGLYQGQQTYPLANGDIDVLKATYRTPTRLSPSGVVSSAGGTVSYLSDADIDTIFTQNAPNGNVVFNWGAGNQQQVALVGLLAGSTATQNLTFSISNDGITFTPVLAPGAVAYTEGEWQWYEIEPTGVPAQYFRIAGSGGAVLSFAEVSLASAWRDVDITRINRDTWASYPNKRSSGDPRQYFMERLIPPQINLWSVPNSTFNLMQLWIHRHIEDVGTLQNSLDIPQRWYQAIITLVSHMAFLELPKEIIDMARYDMLKDEALAISLPDVEKEERDSSPIEIVANIGLYTR